MQPPASAPRPSLHLGKLATVLLVLLDRDCRPLGVLQALQPALASTPPRYVRTPNQHRGARNTLCAATASQVGPCCASACARRTAR
eukprot:4816688-Alexandrium_andersonii.AAC.1